MGRLDVKLSELWFEPMDGKVIEGKDWDKVVTAELEAIEQAEKRGDDYHGGVRGKLEVCQCMG